MTTPNLINNLNNRINHRSFTSNFKFIIQDIYSLFSLNKNNIGLDFHLLNTLKKGFIIENNGALNNRAVATDLIKYLTLYKYGGLYIDSGLEFIYKNNMTQKLDFIHNYMNYDYGYTLNHSLDIQLLYSKIDSVFARNVLKKTLENCFFCINGKPILYNKSIESLRKHRANPNDFIKAFSWTFNCFYESVNQLKSRGKIYTFIVEEQLFFKNSVHYFLDFPSIFIKIPEQQKYENYRNRTPKTMDDSCIRYFE